MQQPNCIHGNMTSAGNDNDKVMDRDELFSHLEGDGNAFLPEACILAEGNESTRLTMNEALDHPVSEDIFDPSTDRQDSSCIAATKSCHPGFSFANDDTLVPIRFQSTDSIGSANAARQAVIHASKAYDTRKADSPSTTSQDWLSGIPFHELHFPGIPPIDQQQERLEDITSGGGDATTSDNVNMGPLSDQLSDNEEDWMDHNARKFDDEKWNEYLHELLAFKAKWGHCCVPYKFRLNPALSRWVRRQRYQYKLNIDGKSGGLTDSRIAILERVGFTWNAHGQKWRNRWNELMAYYVEQGHGNVPHNYLTNPELANWVKNQRRQYKLFQEGKQSHMTHERIDALNSLGFAWDHKCDNKF